MASGDRRLLALAATMTRARAALSLDEAAREANLSPFHLQRAFTAAAGESPARYQQRLRLERAALDLRSARTLRVVDVAVDAGFESHEGFTRAFRKHFGVSPSTYRSSSGVISDATRDLTISAGRCIGLHHRPIASPPIPTNESKDQPMPTSPVNRQDIEETPTIVGRRRVDREKVSEALAEVLPAAYGCAMAKGLDMAGPPFVRYVAESAAFVEVEAGVPLVEPASDVDHEGLFASTLPGGEAAVAIHEGSYDSLGESHIVIDRWINDNGLRAAGGPWEVYLTDPGEVPEPADWRTQIVWPVVG